MSFDNLMGYILSMSICMQNFITIPLSSRDSAIITFSEFGARQSLDQRKMSFRNLLGQILSITMFTQKFIKIFHSVQEIELFSLFQNLALGKASANVISQSFGLDIVNISAYANFCQNIPSGLRVIDSFHEQAGDKIFTNCPVTKSNV